VCAEHGENIAFFDLDGMSRFVSVWFPFSVLMWYLHAADKPVCAHCLLVGPHVGHRGLPIGAAAERRQVRVVLHCVPFSVAVFAHGVDL
jgi:hypothetical protein